MGVMLFSVGVNCSQASVLLLFSVGVDYYQASVVDMGGSQVGVGNFHNYGLWSMDH
jgi:hypothetical protein